MSEKVKSEKIKINDEPIRKVLGDLTPRVAPTAVGRIRLIRALRQRFGRGFRQIEPARLVLSHFDHERKTARGIIAARRLLNGQRNK